MIYLIMYIVIIEYSLAYLVKILKYITTDRFLFTERFHERIDNLCKSRKKCILHLRFENFFATFESVTFRKHLLIIFHRVE